MEWKFRETGIDEKLRNPPHDYLFNDTNHEPATPLIRELIQNSLDARSPESDAKPIQIAFRRKLVADFTDAWMEDIHDHLQSEKNGLDPDTVRTSFYQDPTEVLLIEDFGTTGLLGPHDGRPPKTNEEKSRFSYYYFTQAEGESGKGADSRGSWGLGKQVLPKASTLNTFFAWTIRSEVREDEPEQLLFGQCILKYHDVDGKSYAPDGVFGSMEDLEAQRLPQPCTCPQDITYFAQAVGFERTHEPGLSLCVPYLGKGYAGKNLLKSIIENFYYAIKRDGLEVTIEDHIDSLHVKVTSDNIDALIKNNKELELDQNFTLFQRIVLAHLGETEVHRPPNVRFPYADYDRPLEEMYSNESLQSAGEAFAAGQIIHAQIEFSLQCKHPRQSAEGHVDVYLLRHPNIGSVHPVYYRDELHLSQQQSRNRPRDVFMALFVESSPENRLGALLRDSENPAHTQWMRQSTRARRDYAYAAQIIQCVARLPIRLAQALNRTRSVENRTALANIFPRMSATSDFNIDSTKQHPAVKKSGSKNRHLQSEKGPADIKTRRRRRYEVARRVGGAFRVSGVQEAADDYPIHLRLLVAYDIVKGDPFKQYEPLDFEFDQQKISAGLTGDAKCVSANLNEIVIEANSPNFELVLSGFDPHRDLVINPRSTTLQTSGTAP